MSPSETPVGWTATRTPEGDEWLCVACTREHTRDIEAKLPDEYW